MPDRLNDLVDLVQQARVGDLDACGRLVQATQTMAYAVAVGVLRDRGLAEDAVQEAYLRALRRLEDLDAPGAFIGWLRRIVITVALNMRRAHRRAAHPERGRTTPVRPPLSRRLEHGAPGARDRRRRSSILKSVDGMFSGRQVKIVPTHFPMCTQAWELEIESDGRWYEALAWGVFTDTIVRHIGGDPAVHRAIGVGHGLERLAMLRYGIDDIRKIDGARVA